MSDLLKKEILFLKKRVALLVGVLFKQSEKYDDANLLISNKYKSTFFKIF